jgi:broad specificity phosphatase PhoE
VIERVVATDGDVLVFAHGHLLRILAARWLGEPAAFGGKLLLSTGSVSELGFERERRAIAVWNDTSHHF